MKIAINTCAGGFALSELVFKKLGVEWNVGGYLDNGHFGIDGGNCDQWRSDPLLISAIEEVGVKAASHDRLSRVKIVEIPDGVLFSIYEDHGMESVHENHRVWR